MKELSPEELAALGLSNDNVVEQAITAEKLPPHKAAFVRSMFTQESGGNPNVPTSNANAMGISQIQPGTFKEVADSNWDISNPEHNARAGVRYAIKQFEAANGNPVVAGAGYYGGNGGRIKAANGQAVKDPRNPNAPNTLEYGQQVASRMPDPSKMKELTPEEIQQIDSSIIEDYKKKLQEVGDAAKIVAPALLSGGLANMKGTMSSIGEGLSNEYDKYFGDKYDKIAVSLDEAKKLGVPEVKISQMRKTLEEVRMSDPSSRKSVEEMHNFMPRDIPLLGLAIPAFASTALGKQLNEMSKGIPYLDVLGSGFSSNNPSKMDIAAGRTVDKFIAGIGDLADNALITIGSDNTVNSAVESMSNRKQAQTANDIIMKEFNKNPGPGGAVGDSLIYGLTGEYIGKPLIKYAGKMTSALADVPGEVVSKSKGFLTHNIDKAAASGIPILSPGGKMAQTEFTQPWAERALHNTRATKPWQSTFRDHGGSILGPALLGAGEGGLHYDHTTGEGALSSVLGQKIGERVGPWLTRGRDYRADIPGEAPLRDFAYKEGWSHTPGDDLGNQYYQRFEAGLRNNGEYANRLKQYDVANIITRNQSVFESMGIPRKSIKALTPENLVAHENSLKEQYNKLVDGTIGSFDFKDRNLVTAHLANLAKNTSDEGTSASKAAQYYANEINKSMGVSRNAMGQVKPSIINGEEFQNLRSNLKSDISGAWANGDRTKAQALQPLLDVLDGSVEKGIARKGGNPDANIAAWKELNRKWAVTQTIKEHGLTHLGSFDPIKFANHAMSVDNSRYLKETGGPEMTKIFKWAKHAKMRKENAGSDLGGMGVHADSLAPKRTLLNTLLKPFNANTPLTDPALRMYLAGWPAKTGLANMSGVGFGNPTLYSRAFSSSQQPWPTLYHKAENAVDSTIEGARNIQQEILDALNKKK